MAAENISGDEKQNTFDQLIICSAGLTAGLHGHLALISGLNMFLSVTAFHGNVLVLVALRRVSSLHPPSKLLLQNLATTELCVGLISEPLFVAYLMSVVNEHWNICRYVLIARFITDYVLCGVSLMTLTSTAISVDRHLALLLGLRYRQVVTLKRTYVIVITFWIASTAFSTIRLWNFLITIWYSCIGISLCLVISISSYTKIFFTLRHRQNQVQEQAKHPNQTNQLNIVRYRKAVSTALWLELTLVAYYLPYFIVMGLAANAGLSSSVYLAWRYAATVVFLNSSLNPILYCWKIDEVRQAVKDAITQALCCSSS